MSIKIVSHRREVEENTEKGILAGLEVMGGILETRAKKNETAVDTGLLRNSITHAVYGTPIAYVYRADKARKRADKGRKTADKGRKADITVGEVETKNALQVGTSVEYAKYIEEGTRKFSGIHFLRRALTENVRKLERAFVNEVKKYDHD